MNMDKKVCYYCGREMTISPDGVANHLTEDGEIDYETDADHVAVDDAEF